MNLYLNDYLIILMLSFLNFFIFISQFPLKKNLYKNVGSFSVLIFER